VWSTDSGFQRFFYGEACVALAYGGMNSLSDGTVEIALRTPDSYPIFKPKKKCRFSWTVGMPTSSKLPTSSTPSLKLVLGRAHKAMRWMTGGGNDGPCHALWPLSFLVPVLAQPHGKSRNAFSRWELSLPTSKSFLSEDTMIHIAFIALPESL
jgi:hypothetical protein